MINGKADRLDNYRVFLHELARRSMVPGAGRADLMAYVTNQRQHVPAPQLEVLSRLVNSVPLKSIADVIRRQPEFRASENAYARRPSARPTLCSNCGGGVHFATALRRGNSWLCARCAEKETRP